MAAVKENSKLEVQQPSGILEGQETKTDGKLLDRAVPRMENMFVKQCDMMMVVILLIPLLRKKYLKIKMQRFY